MSARDVSVEAHMLNLFGLSDRAITKLVVTCEVGIAPMLEITEQAPACMGPEVVSTYRIVKDEPAIEAPHE